MIYPAILERKYKQYLPLLESVAKQVKEALLNFCESQGYAFTSRLKKIESLAEKIETGRYAKWSDIDDLFACTIIIPNLSLEGEVIQFCQNIFEFVKAIKRGQNKKSPETFKFDSTRLSCRLKRGEGVELDSAPNIFDITFEIQIKSAFEHAWAVSTHDLVYKSAEVNWKKLRLAAQIKAVVEQLDTMILAFEEISPAIQESNDPELKRKVKIADVTRKLFSEKKLPEELKPKDMNRFCDNLYAILVRTKKEQEIDALVQCIKKEINSTPDRKIPRSLSLFQYFISILVKKEKIDLPADKYHLHVTSELTALEPIFKSLSNAIFDYEL